MRYYCIHTALLYDDLAVFQMRLFKQYPESDWPFR